MRRLVYFLFFATAACATQDAPPAGPAAEAQYAGLDATARAHAEAALQQALETHVSGAPLRWSETNGTAGRVVPLRTFRIATGHYCRDFREIVVAAGETHDRRATACRDGKGVWRRVAPPAS